MDEYAAQEETICALVASIRHLQGELGFIRAVISEMCSGPCAPNPLAIIDTLYPSESQCRPYVPPEATPADPD